MAQKIDQRALDLINAWNTAGDTGQVMRIRPTVQGKKGKSFLQDNISTLGGVGGGALGGAAGGALAGTAILPGIGTAAGALIGAALGGGLGSAGGQVLENKIVGDDLSHDVLKEGLIGGASVAPIRGASMALKGGKALLGGGGGKALAEALNQGATSTPIRSALGMGATKLGRTGDSLMASQGLTTTSQNRALGLKPNDTFGNINTRTGLTSLDDMAEVGRRITGNGEKSILDQMTRGAIEGSRVDVGDIRKSAQTLLDESGAALSPAQVKSLLAHSTRAGASMRGGAAGSIDPLVDGTRALDQANTFRNLQRQLTSGFNPDPDKKILGDIYGKLAKQIEDGIYGAKNGITDFGTIRTSGADDLLFAADDLAKAGKTAQANALRKVSEEVRGVQDLAGLRGLKKDFVDIGKIDNATAQAAGARTLGGQDMTKQAGDAIRNPLNLLAKPLDANSHRIGGALKSLAGKTGPGSEAGAISPLSAALRIGGVGALTNPGTPEESIDQSAALTGDLMGTPGMDQMQEPTNSLGYSSGEVQQAMMQAIMAGDTKAFQQLSQLNDMITAEEEAQAPQKLNSAQATAAAKASTAEDALGRLESLYSNAGGGGLAKGTLAGALGAVNLNPGARTYQSQLAATARLLGRAMGETGAGSDADAAAFIGMLPSLTDSPETAAAKLAEIRARLQDAQRNTLLYGGGLADQQSQAY